MVLDVKAIRGLANQAQNGNVVYKCGCCRRLSGILTYARIRQARRSWVEPPNFYREYLMP